MLPRQISKISFPPKISKMKTHTSQKKIDFAFSKLSPRITSPSITILRKNVKYPTKYPNIRRQIVDSKTHPPHIITPKKSSPNIKTFQKGHISTHPPSTIHIYSKTKDFNLTESHTKISQIIKLISPNHIIQYHDKKHHSYKIIPTHHLLKRQK